MVLDGHVAYAPLQWNLVTGFLLTNNLPMIPPDIRNLARPSGISRRKAIIHYTGELQTMAQRHFHVPPSPRRVAQILPHISVARLANLQNTTLPDAEIHRNHAHKDAPCTRHKHSV